MDWVSVHLNLTWGFFSGNSFFLSLQNRLPVKNIWPGCCAPGLSMTVWRQPEAPFICIRPIPSELRPWQFSSRASGKGDKQDTITTFSKEGTDIASTRWMVVLEKETHLEMVENLKILSERKWLYLHSFASQCSVTIRSILSSHLPSPKNWNRTQSNYLIVFVFSCTEIFTQVDTWKLPHLRRIERLRITISLPKIYYSLPGHENMPTSFTSMTLLNWL